MGEDYVAANSILRKFEIKDDVVCERLLDELENTPMKKVERKLGISSYERGKELLLTRYGKGM